MSKLSDRDRILVLLSDSEGLSNLHVKAELNFNDGRYQTVRQQLLDEGLIEKYVCRGGGIRLTRKGAREVPGDDDLPNSTVAKEADLYKPLVEFLRRQTEEDGVEAMICDTHHLKARGQWQNPDITRVGIEHHRHLRKMRVVIGTYEVKQFPRWDVSAVYEAASHHRFSHAAMIVLEWPNDIPFSPTDHTFKLDQIVRECQRFGVGLSTMHQYYSSYRLHPRLDPELQSPTDDDVETWLGYVFSRDSDAEADFHARVTQVLSLVDAPSKYK